MERSERNRLESIGRRLRQDLVAIDSLLRTSDPPRHRSKTEIKRRATAVCHGIQAQGGSVSKDRLRAIASKHGMAFGAVGALFAGEYLRKSGRGVGLGRRGLAAVAGTKKKRRRTARN